MTYSTRPVLNPVAVIFTAMVFSIALVPRFSLAHGVKHSVSEGATVVTAQYDDGSPMAFCDVSVFAPQDSSETYQEGTSDRNGCFAFLPDTNGTWKVTVDDGMGHLAEVEIEVDADGRKISEEEHSTDRLGGAVVGVCIIFGIFGIYGMLAGRREREVKTSEQGE